LNDITIAELEQFVASAAAADPLLQRMVDAGSLKCLPSGQASTLLDLSTTGPELNGWVTDEMNKVSDGEDWLLVLDGMGRSLESNWYVCTRAQPSPTQPNTVLARLARLHPHSPGRTLLGLRHTLP